MTAAVFSSSSPLQRRCFFSWFPSVSNVLPSLWQLCGGAGSGGRGLTWTVVGDCGVRCSALLPFLLCVPLQLCSPLLPFSPSAAPTVLLSTRKIVVAGGDGFVLLLLAAEARVAAFLQWCCYVWGEDDATTVCDVLVAS
uniref:Uncharacterized protein n=1 Tax=Populus alba TaxID=43335 RepID=A0A4U5NPK5_POPAL|nr:hypothetical protein D5086_0000245300 [Populus alba]